MSGEDTRYHTSLAINATSEGGGENPSIARKNPLFHWIATIGRITNGMTLELSELARGVQLFKNGIPPWISITVCYQRREGPL